VFATAGRLDEFPRSSSWRTQCSGGRERDRQHPWRTVNADDRATEPGQILSGAASAAGGVQRDTTRQTVQDLPDNGLLQVNELVPRLVIGFFPGAITLDDRDRPDFRPAVQLVRRVQQRPDLCQSGLGEIAVIIPSERVEPGWVLPVVVLGSAATVVVKTTYDAQIKRFWNEIRADWQAHERMLTGDPRNGPAA